MLNEIARKAQHPHVVALAIAHGATVDEALVAALAWYATPGCAAMLEEAGACLVGATVFDISETAIDGTAFQDTEAFLARGVDWGFDSGMAQLLITVINSVGEYYIQDERLLDTLLGRHCCVAVDVRDGNGRTPLLLVASMDYDEDAAANPPDPTSSIAGKLLQYCDVSVVDRDGRTALHFAAEHNLAVVELLLKSGADPNARDDQGQAPHDYVRDGRWEDDCCSWWKQFVRLVLKGGVDPFAPARGVQDSQRTVHSLYDRLMERPSGPDFVAKHPEYFHGRGDDGKGLVALKGI